MNRFKLLHASALAFTLFAFSARAEEATTESSDPVRVQKPFTLMTSFGNPSPAYFGASLGLQIHPYLQVLGSWGQFWDRDFRIRTLAAAARFFPLQTKLSPFVGAGMSYFFLTGSGLFQSLDSTIALPFLTLGLDLTIDAPFRLAAGVHFHFPISIIFPFVDFGYSF